MSDEQEELLAKWRKDGWDACIPSELSGEEAWRRNGVYVPVWEVEKRFARPPLCDGCAQAWFTERNLLKGDHHCVVCAFLGNTQP